MMMAALVLCGSISASSAQEKTTVAGVPMVKLNNGVWMPRFGLGTFLQPSNDVCRQSCLTALRAGYRHIDTAHAKYRHPYPSLFRHHSGLHSHDAF